MSRVFPPRAAKLRSKGRQERSFGCAAGRVVLRRRYFQTRDGESGGCLVDDALGIAARMLSVGMRQLICQAGTESRSFGRGAGLLKSQAGLSVGKEQMRQVVHAEARLVQQMSAKEQLDPGWKASEALTTTPQGQRVSRVMVAADGVMVPTTTQASKDKRRKTVVARRREMPADRRVELKPLEPVRKGSDNGYKVAYLTRFYDQDKSHTLVGVTDKGMPGLRRLLRRESSRILLRGAQERLGLVDGAVCLGNCLELVPLMLILLDFYHLSQNLSKAIRAVYGEGSPQGQTRTDALLHTVRHGGYEPFYEALLVWRGELRGQKRKAVDRLTAYVVERREMMRYDEAERRGCDVGSGPMESQCGVTTDRVKGRGRRWDLANATGMMALEALHQSNLWNSYWTAQSLLLN